MQDLFGQTITNFHSYQEILDESSKDGIQYLPKSGNVFGYWMQTLADIQLLDLELSGLTKGYKIDALNYTVDLNGANEYVRSRVAHLDLVDSKQTLYSYLTDLFGDTNAYAFHNLYPYKGKFYPRIVRTVINTFNLNENHLVLDPYNGCGTTTHESGLMGIQSIGVDINPIGNIISELKNELIFLDSKKYDLTNNDLTTIFNYLENKKRPIKDDIMFKLLLLIYFDTKDAFVRTTKYNRKGLEGLFIEKFNYIKDCYKKTKIFLNEFNLQYEKSVIKEGNVLDLNAAGINDETIDAIITSPPYYFSLDYIGKDKIAYDYLNAIGFFSYNMENIKNEYLGMKVKQDTHSNRLIEKKVITYFDDLENSIKEMIRVLKPNGKIAIIIGDSTLEGKKLPTTQKTHEYCIKYGLNHIRTVFNPLLGSRNRAIRGESILLYNK